ncbi:hypothetical protein BP6252_10205 [Coleophoma cylindrospora]|uniref:Uncharacterized protein n=1 Tax=Coleophoma cylindrospora TaxID=1849047 RepID=A0A3D8QY00_9HELO|nr:hypothetical protein BP6252_10205 [Coleophoma cylindrospora]
MPEVAAEIHSLLQEVCVASPDRSIWRDLSEETFRQHLVTLEERTNAIPVDPQVFSIADWVPRSAGQGEKKSHVLPIDVEQRLADDFACLVAVAEGAQSVAAVCIEEHLQPVGLTLRFAARDLSFNNEIKTTLQAVFDILAHVAATPTLADDASLSADKLFGLVIQLHSRRLLGRLRSSKWEKPKHLSRSVKKPLWQDFPNLIHRTEFLYTRREKPVRNVVLKWLGELAVLYEQFEATAKDETLAMTQLVKATFTFCSAPEIKDFAERLRVGSKPTSQVRAAIKSLRQLDKIAAYHRICISLVETARAYPMLFHRMTLAILPPYKSVPTSIAFQSWAASCHVHAEVQLAVHYDLHREFQPRCIGTSKWLCYLCYLFLRAHGRHFPSKTHGHLYDQWTVPDVMDLDEKLTEQYRGILKAIDDVVLQQIDEEPELGRLEPMTSCTA